MNISCPGQNLPTVTIYSTLDRLIARNSAQFTYDYIGPTGKILITLQNSGHDVSLDSEWKGMAEQTYQFIRKHLPAEYGDLTQPENL